MPSPKAVLRDIEDFELDPLQKYVRCASDGRLASHAPATPALIPLEPQVMLVAETLPAGILPVEPVVEKTPVVDVDPKRTSAKVKKTSSA